MARNRVLSFMSQFSNRDSRSPPPSSPTLQGGATRAEVPRQDAHRQAPRTPPQQHFIAESRDSPQALPQRDRGLGEYSSSRPMSMVQTYQPPLMEMNQDTLPELQPIFTFLNSHGNKLYQEGYFLKLDDQNSHGKPNADRTWTECFAQLVGTVLSLWDAAELDAAGQDGEVLPKFINLTDASIKMIEALPTRSNDDQPLQNVLSISTAGKNRYLLHFNSHHSLIQWTAGIRLAMFEHATLQESYTGALIAGKGRSLNNINIIMERSKIKTEDWVRVRFGAGTPWRRCWCVISPPDEKEYQKLQKELNKKKSAYDRSRPPALKGDVKFYDTKKTKKVRPIASITDAYSAFAIYPQSKPLIDASTLIKVEGTITIHSNPPSSTEGFVFVMPEVHAAVSGFEMMLRWLFPVFDTFALYGRPGRLIADTLDPRSLMFAMPKERRYGYLEILDVSGLILTDGSQNWREMDWRHRMKELTSKRMTAITDGSKHGSRYSARRSTRNSFGPSRSRADFNDGASVRSTPSVSWGQAPAAEFGGIPRVDSAPAGTTFQPLQATPNIHHHRSISESQGLDRYHNQGSPGLEGGYDGGPSPPPHGVGSAAPRDGSGLRYQRDITDSPDRMSLDDDLAAARATPVRELKDLQESTSVAPVATPPAFAHAPGTLPASKPYHSPELRRAKSRMSHSTLSQMEGAGGMAPGAGMAVAYGSGNERPRTSEDQRRQNFGGQSEDRGVLPEVNTSGINANQNSLTEGLVATTTNRLSFEHPLPTPPIPHINDDHAFTSTTGNRQYHSPNISVNAASSAPPNPPGHQYLPTGLSNSTSISSSPGALAPVVVEHPTSIIDQHQGHTHNSSTDSTRTQLNRLSTNQEIPRKPLPVGNTMLNNSNISSPQTASSTGSTGTYMIDQDAFDRVVPRDQIEKMPLHPEPQVQRQTSTQSSLYEDARSNATPDYGNTRQSTDSRQSLERPRAGVMRTVGTTEQAHAAGEFGEDSIPNVDFGPTMNLAANQLPREQSPAGQRTPRHAHNLSSHVRSSSHNTAMSEPDQYKDTIVSGGNRFIPWQPGMTAGMESSPVRRALTPEQFVQQRAGAVTPHYAHQRQSSGNNSRSGTPTLPPAQNRASEYSLEAREQEKKDMKQRLSGQAVQHAISQRPQQGQGQAQTQYQGTRSCVSPAQGGYGRDDNYQQYSTQYQHFQPQQQQRTFSPFPVPNQGGGSFPTQQRLPTSEQRQQQYFPQQQDQGRSQQTFRGP